MQIINDPIKRRETKLRKSALDNNVRQRLLSYVKKYPKIPISFIAADLSLDKDNVEFHINVLKRVGEI